MGERRLTLMVVCPERRAMAKTMERAQLTGAVLLGLWSCKTDAQLSKASDGLKYPSAVLTASDGTDGDEFGQAVSLYGSTALISAQEANVATTGGTLSQAGKAYIFTRTGNDWYQSAILTASDAVAGDDFGDAVSLKGSTALIGAPSADVNGITDAGKVYVFTGSGASHNGDILGADWNQQATLTASDLAENDDFGDIVVLSDDEATALIHATKDVADQTSAGAVLVFVRNEGTWKQQATLTASDYRQGAEFGQSGIALSGNTALIGAPGQPKDGYENVGQAYIFTASNGVWTQQAALTAGDWSAEDQFGNYVALSGNTAAISGAASAVNGVSNAGKVYVFTGSGNSWSQQATLTASDYAQGSEFGRGLSMSSPNAILIGADEHDYEGIKNVGQAYLFVGGGNNWKQQNTLLPGDIFPESDFSRKNTGVSLNGGYAVIGQRASIATPAQRGRAYVFKWDVPGPSDDSWVWITVGCVVGGVVLIVAAILGYVLFFNKKQPVAEPGLEAPKAPETQL